MPGPTLNSSQKHLLKTILERGAESASQALSKWLARPVQLEIRDVEEVEIERAIESFQPVDKLVPACSMALAGRITGETILVFEESSGLALSDIIQSAPLGTSKEWGEFERSVAQETTNIVGCAFLNAVASHLPGGGNSIIPGPPEFRLEFAASLLEFALFDQAAQLERVLLIETRFLAEPSELGWTLLLAPSADTLRDLAAALDQPAA